MFKCLDRVDWNLLHRQKLATVQLLATGSMQPSDAEALWGIVHLLDALQDDAAAAGRWSFPEEPIATGDSQ